MDGVLGVTSAALSGGAFGLLGTTLGRVVGVFERRAEQAHERARWAHELRRLELEQRARAAEAEGAQALARTQGAYEGLTASLNADAAFDPGYKWVDAVRALVRPVLTPLLWLLYLAVFHAVAAGELAPYLAPGAAGELLSYFVTNVAFAATAATLWWFGDRAPPPRRGGALLSGR